MRDFNSLIQLVSIGAIPVIFAITLHEAAHGYVARRFGDSTAYMMGRVTLNPIKHIDPIGTVLVPLICVMFGSMFFGWAKPVPVNFDQLRNPKRDMFWVAAAGPGANLFMIFFWAIIVKLAGVIPGNFFSEPMKYMGLIGMQINAVLMVLNLLPVPPLDGGRIAVSLLPMPWARRLSLVEPYGMFILIALLVANVLGVIIGPFVAMTLRLVRALFGI